MVNSELIVRTAILTNKDRLPDSFLVSGRISEPTKEKTFLFFMLEIPLATASAARVKRTITTVIEKKHKEFCNNFKEGCFEKILESINAALDNLTKSGDREWIGNLNAVIGSINENEISIAQTGSMCGYLFRKNNISEIIGTNKIEKIPLPINTFTDITYGQLFPEDRIVIGNKELYNHISLDRIRKLVTGIQAKESASELFDFFHKGKIFNVNAIIFDVNTKAKIENETILETPEIYYLDQSSESIVKKFRKICIPLANSCKKHLNMTLHQSSKLSQEVYNFIKEKWQTKLKPASQKALKSGSKNLSATFSSTSGKIKPALAKISKDYKPNFKTSSYKSKEINNKALSYCTGLLGCLKIVFEPKNRKYLYMGLLVIVFCFGYFKVKNNNVHRSEIRNQMELADSYDKAKDAYNKAKDDLSLGKSGAADELQAALALAQKASGYNPNKDKALSLSHDIQSSLDSISKSVRLFNPAPVITFNQDIQKILLVNSDIYALSQEGKIYLTNLSDKTPSLVSAADKSDGMINDFTFFESANQIILPTSAPKILAYDTNKKNISELSLESNKAKWQNVKSAASYASNIYLLDSDAGAVWKYVKKDDGFSKGTSAISNAKANIQGATSIAIDGNIYILRNDGKVQKFVRGSLSTDFSLQNMPAGYSQISQPDKVFTNEDTNYIFVLDKGFNRIIRFNKGGEYTDQFFLDGLKIDDFTVNGKTQKIYALSEGKVYEINF